MQITNILLSAAALVVSVAAAPAPNENKCVTKWRTTTVYRTQTKTSYVYTTSVCPIASLPLSPIVTGTLVPITSIVGAVTGLLPREAEPSAALEGRGDDGCTKESWRTEYKWAPAVTTTVTSTVKTSCNIVNVPKTL